MIVNHIPVEKNVVNGRPGCFLLSYGFKINVNINFLLVCCIGLVEVILVVEFHVWDTKSNKLLLISSNRLFDIFWKGMMGSPKMWANFYRISFLNMTYRIVASTNTCYYSENQLFVKRSQYIRTKNPLHKQSEMAKTCH